MAKTLTSFSRVLACSFGLMLCAHSASAASVFWDGAGADVNWSTLGNWGTTGANATTDPLAIPGATDDVIFYSTGGLQLTTNVLDTAFTLQSLTFGNSQIDAVTVGGTGLLTLNGKANYDAGALSSGSFGNLGTVGLFVQGGTGATTISAPIALGGSQQWINNSGNGLTATGGVALGANQLTISGTGNTTIQSAVSGTGGLIKAGTGTLTLNRANSYSGSTIIRSGTLTLGGSNGSIASSSGVTLGGINATLTINNSASNNNGDRLSTGGLTSNGGTFNWINSAGAANYSEAIGGLTLNAGALTINTSRAASGQTSALTIDSITRIAGGTVLFSGANFGVDTRHQVLVTNAPTNVNGILPWALIQDSAAAASGGINLAVGGAGGAAITQLATYQTGNGTSTTWVPATGTANARPGANAAFTTSQAAGQINSLVLDTGTTLGSSSTADRTTTILSGLVVQTGGTSTLLGTSGSTDMILAFGTSEAIFNTIGTLVWQRGNATQTTGSGGLTKTGAGTLQMGVNGDLFVNGITGTLNLNQGLLEIYSGGTTALSSLSTGINLNGGNLTIHDGTARSFNNPLVLNADTTITGDRHAAAQGAGVNLTFGTLAVNNTPVLNVTAGPNVTSGTQGVVVGAVALNSHATFNVVNGASAGTSLTLGTITGTNDITKTGSGTLILSIGSTGYSAGTVTLNGGTLRAMGASASTLGLSTGAVQLALVSGTLELANDTARSYTRPTTVSGNVTITTDTLTAAPGVTHTLGTLAIGAQTLTVQSSSLPTSTQGLTFGAVALNGPATFNVISGTNATTALTLGSITGTSNLTKTGTGTLILASSSSAYTAGTITLNGGTLRSQTSSSSNTLGSASGAVQLALVSGTLELASDTGRSPNRPTTVSGDVTITTDTLTAVPGVTHTLGTLSIGAQNLTVQTSALPTAGSTQGLTFGATTLTGTPTFTVNNGANAGTTLTLGALGDGGSAFGFTKSGTGTLKLAANSTFTGPVTLSAGVLRAEGSFPTALGTGAATLTLAGGELQLANESATLSNHDYLRDTTVTGNAKIVVDRVTDGTTDRTQVLGALSIGNQNLAVQGGLHNTNATGIQGLTFGATTLSGTPIFDVQAAQAGSATTLLTVGAISETGGPQGFTKNGPGTMKLTANSTFTGPVTLNAGVLRAEGSFADALGTGASTLTLAGGELQLVNGSSATADHTYNRNTTVTANSKIVVDRTTSGTVEREQILGTLAIGSQTLTVQGGINNTTGNQLLTFGSTTLSGSPVFDVQGVQTGTGVAFLTVGGISETGGAQGFTKNGPGIMLIGNASSITGPVTLNAGTLRLGSSVALGTSPLTINGGTLSTSGTTARTLTNPITVGGDFTMGQQSGNLTLNGTMDLGASDRTITVSNAQVNTIGGVISGSARLIKEGAGVLTLTGSNTYTGGVTINAGTVIVDAGTSLGALPAAATPGFLLINGGTLQTSTAFTLSANRGIALSSNTANQIAPAGGALVYGGIIADQTTSGVLTVGGTGSLTLTGANTYSGGTTITSTVIANNTTGSALGTGSVVVDSAATLGGSGSITLTANNLITINGALTVGNVGDTVGADLMLTTSGIGSTILGSGSTMFLDIFGGAGHGSSINNTQADLVRLFGDLTINAGTTLKLGNPNAIVSSLWADGDTFQLFDWASLGASRTGSFTTVDYADLNLPSGWSVDMSNLSSLGTVSIVSLAPEPSRVLLLGVGLCCGVLRRRRNRP